MSRVVLAALALALIDCWHRPEPPRAAQPGVATSADDLFSLAFVPALDITLDDKARQSLLDDPRTYVPATLTHGGRTLPIQIKLKGNRTFRDLDDKPALRIEFGADGFLGLHGLSLNNMVELSLIHI